MNKMIQKNVIRFAVSHIETAFHLYDNIGENLFRQGLLNLMKNHEHIREQELKQGDFFIVLFSNCITNDHNDYLQSLAKNCANYRQMGVKVILLGCGSQAASINSFFELNRDNVEYIRMIAETNTIGVRGGFTKKILDKAGFQSQTFVLGCPSIFYKDVIISRTKPSNRPIKLAFQSTIYGNVLASFHTDMFCMKYKGTFFPQTEFRYYTWGARNIDSVIDEIKNYKKDNDLYEVDRSLIATLKYYSKHQELVDTSSTGGKNFPKYDFVSHLKYMCTHIVDPYTSIDDWIKKLTEYDLLLTSRIHGAVAGLLAGIRVLCIIHDSRTHELCESLKIPYVTDLDYNNSIEYYYELADTRNYHSYVPQIRKKYVDFLKMNGIEIF